MIIRTTQKYSILSDHFAKGLLKLG